MVASAKHKIETMEERNAISVFSRADVAGLPETDAFFASVRQVYVYRALKLACVTDTAEEETSTGSSTDQPTNAEDGPREV